MTKLELDPNLFFPVPKDFFLFSDIFLDILKRNDGKMRTWKWFVFKGVISKMSNLQDDEESTVVLDFPPSPLLKCQA